MSRSYLAAVVYFLLAGPAMAEVSGVVTSSSGVRVEAARVDVVGGGLTYTDAEGRFEFPEVDAPVRLVVSHPRFHAQTVDLAAGEVAIEVALVAKQEIFEEIVVSANRGEVAYAPVSVAASFVDPETSPVPPATVTDLVVSVPGVSQNGQGGLFQVFSIRGVSRQRVLTLLEGTRVVSDRRAGVSASFLEPQLLESVDVVRGPSSTFYGSGALGGVVQLFTRDHEELNVRAGYESQGDENHQVVGWGRSGWSLGLARRDAGSSETPGGERIPSGFTQYSGTLRKIWEAEAFSGDALIVGAAGRDIEKASTDFPNRVTVYPEENHLLFRLALTGRSGWSISAWAHPNDLTTEVLDVGESQARVENESTELGASWQHRFDLAGTRSLAVGAEYFGRLGVDSRESRLDFGSGRTDVLKTLDGAEEDQLGAYGAFEWRMKKATAVAGLRSTWQSQSNEGFDSADDSAISGFVSLVTPLGQGFELAANIGSGLRFPTLSERFFSGTTGRGGVIGNPDLDPERSLSFDLGLRWYGERLFFTASAFRNDIDDYIERIEVEEDLLSFVNLVSGTIEGLELQVSWAFRPFLSVALGGHLIEGEADDGKALADIPPDRLDLTLDHQGERWGSRLRWEYRDAKTEIGSGEKPIPSVQLIGASLSYAVTDRVRLTLSGDNLLDEEYFNSADRKVPLSAGRSMGLTLAWTAR